MVTQKIAIVDNQRVQTIELTRAAANTLAYKATPHMAGKSRGSKHPVCQIKGFFEACVFVTTQPIHKLIERRYSSHHRAKP